MLNPNNDRLDYGQILSAPDKYKLDFAIGTTYSLDLDALIGANLALGLSEDMDSRLSDNPIVLLEALRLTASKIALYCEAGQIHLPGKVTPLYMLLEQMVYQVSMPKGKSNGIYPSFHPKFWLIRYVNGDKEPLYRVIVLSRNLTFDRSWDVTFYIDGTKNKNETSKNQPLKDFLTYLLNFSKKSSVKQKKIKQIIKELSYIHFELNSKEFDDYDFISVGVPKENGNVYSIKDYPLFTGTFQEALIMSPFLSDEIIKDFNNRSTYIKNKDLVLITRAMSLVNLKPENCNNFRIYTVKDAVIDGESVISDGENDIRKQDIHAKVFMIKKYSDSELYLGSLNASHNAVYGNIEIVIRLKAKNRYLNLTKLTESLFCGAEDNPNNPFERVDLTRIKNSEVESDDLSAVIKNIARLKAKAHIKFDGKTYSIKLSFNKVIEGYEIKISPLFANMQVCLEREMEYSNLTLMQLSEFYRVTVSDGKGALERIIMFPTEGLPEERERKIISSIIRDKSGFYQYVSFLLGGVFAARGDLYDEASSSGFVTNYQTAEYPALYEKMLKAVYEEPEKLHEIEYLMKALVNEDVVPPKFEELFRTFKKAVGYRD